MMELVPFQRSHLERMNLRDFDKMIFDLMKTRKTLHIETAPFNYTFFVKGVPFFCGGIVEFWGNRGELWAIFDQKSKTYFLEMFNRIRRFIEIIPFKRIEATVQKNYSPGHRFISLLGFEIEAPLLKCYYPDGQDGVLYSLIRKRD